MKVAAEFCVGLCPDPKCRSLHFDLLDEDGEVFAGAVVAIEDTAKMIESIRDMAYHIATLKEP